MSHVMCRWGWILLLWANSARAQTVPGSAVPAGEQKPPPIDCQNCHVGEKAVRVQDFWQPGIAAETAVATGMEDHPQAAMVSIRRSLDTTHDALQKAQAVIARLETTTDIPVENLVEKIKAAEEKFTQLQGVPVANDQEAIAASAQINLGLQKIWTSVERTRDERKSRLAFAVLVLASVVFLLTTLAGLKRFLPEPVVLPEPGLRKQPH